MRGKGTKLGEGNPEKFGIIAFVIITIFGIKDFYIRDCFVWEKFAAPKNGFKFFI